VTAVTDWRSVFIVPTIITSAAAVAHLIWFREESARNVQARIRG